jgi:phage shock protein C
MKGRKFYLDKQNGKWMGVCAGLSRLTGWDATLIRVGLVVVTLAGAFPWTLIAYVAAGLIAKPRPYGLHDEADEAPVRRAGTSTAALAASTRDIDRRLAEVENYVTTGNSTLAREIEALR